MDLASDHSDETYTHKTQVQLSLDSNNKMTTTVQIRGDAADGPIRRTVYGTQYKHINISMQSVWSGVARVRKS